MPHVSNKYLERSDIIDPEAAPASVGIDPEAAPANLEKHLAHSTLNVDCLKGHAYP